MQFHIFFFTEEGQQKANHFNAAINILREGVSSLSLDIVRLEGSSEYCLKLESNAL